MSLAPPDSDERLFLRIVEAGSLKAAAAQLGSDPSSVSRRLAALETRLGQQLVRRSTRGSKPTEAGARYYEGLAQLVAQQDALEAAVAGGRDEPQGRLHVTAPPEFGVRFVVPVLEQLQRRYPALVVELALGTAFTNLAERGLDAAVRIGKLSDSSLRARKLGVVPRLLVASPAYLDAAGTPRSLAELPEHRVISYLTRSGVNRVRARTPRGDLREVEVRPVFTVNSISTLVRMVEGGAGINLAPRWAFADALAAGRVVALFEDHRFEAYPVQIVYPSRRYLPAKTRAFIESMADSLGRQPSLRQVRPGARRIGE
ncbi:transcriptional regulator, LysR family protein [Plesiocystis pacifica SIR-1]|uniref:Transcriptional regulator, LysR family protein n=1 Tax=Plesiocystis pacifica SIR-1 TaxID=391625 RepID=A6GH95_9BACT|nr:LysR family transcriptional regulator [Plesiocystis pacifica]EDM74764.1 transcriptional regulator, LysR family protein [Plesiocystis pacifica SIR-1]